MASAFSVFTEELDDSFAAEDERCETSTRVGQPRVHVVLTGTRPSLWATRQREFGQASRAFTPIPSCRIRDKLFSTPTALASFPSTTEWRAITCGLSAPVTSSQLGSRLTPSAEMKGSEAADDGWAAIDLLLTMERLRQLVATGGNRFGRFEPFCGSPDLRPVATGCNHGAP
jgi:hypothetical protein